MNADEKKKWIHFIQDVYLSKDWSFRPELLKLSAAELNEVSMEYLISLMDEKPPFGGIVESSLDDVAIRVNSGIEMKEFDHDEYREMVLTLKKQIPTDSKVDMSNHEDYIVVLRREEIRKMYLSKDWTLKKPYLFDASITRLNDFFARELLKMKEEGVTGG